MAWSEVKVPGSINAGRTVKFSVTQRRLCPLAVVSIPAAVIAELGIAPGAPPPRLRVDAGGGDHVGYLRLTPDAAGPFALAFRGPKPGEGGRGGSIALSPWPGLNLDPHKPEACAFDIEDGGGGARALIVTLPDWALKRGEPESGAGGARRAGTPKEGAGAKPGRPREGAAAAAPPPNRGAGDKRSLSGRLLGDPQPGQGGGGVPLGHR